MWEQLTFAWNQMWVWLTYEVSLHPFLFAGVIIVVVCAFILYKSEIESR